MAREELDDLDHDLSDLSVRGVLVLGGATAVGGCTFFCKPTHSKPRTDESYDLYDIFPLQFMI